MATQPLNTIRVTSQTTLNDLKAFQEGIGKDDAKLRGTVNKDGSITLKAVDRDSSFFSKMFGISKKRRDAARSALTMVMTNSGAVDRKATGSLTSLINADRAHSPRSAALKDLVKFAKSRNVATKLKVDQTNIKGSHTSDLMKRKFPTLENKNLSMATLDRYAKVAADIGKDGPLAKIQITQIGNEIRTDLMRQLTKDGPLSHNDRALLGVSDIRKFVSDALSEAVPDQSNPDVAAALDDIAKNVADQMTLQLLGTKHVDDDTFMIGNESFKKIEVIGQGGFGKAILYRSETTGKEVVLKVPANSSDDDDAATIKKQSFDFKAEIDMHTKIMDNDGRPNPDMRYPHVLQYEGAVRLPSGAFATITQACTSGDMSKLMKAIDKAVTDGNLTPDQAMAAKLTMMRDMVDGQEALHSWGFSHRDVKFQNVFVDGKGVAKVADFGESAFETDFGLWDQKIVENPLYLAPENLVAKEKVNAFGASVMQSKVAHVKAKIDVFNSLVGEGGLLANLGLETIDGPVTTKTEEGLRQNLRTQLENVPEYADLIKVVLNDSTGAEARRLQKAIDTGKAQMPANTLVNGSAADVWSFGTAMLHSFIGLDKSINANFFASKSETALLEYFNAKPVDPGNGLPPTPLPEALVPGSFLIPTFVSPHPNGTVTGDPDIDRLINSILKRDPDDRPSFADILKDPVFTREGVGDTATRNVIAALGGKPPKTADEIKQLAAKMTV